MNFIKKHIVNLLTIFRLGKMVFSDAYFRKTAQLSALENLKTPRRRDIINYFVAYIDAQYYLEIGVRDPKKNFERIDCNHKFSVDPGVEYEENPVDFKMTSDLFFKKLQRDELSIKSDIKF